MLFNRQSELFDKYNICPEDIMMYINYYIHV